MAYQESDRVKKYAEDLAKAETAKPGEWTGGTVSTQVDDALGKILNREEFKYDFNNDALYNQYAQRYQQQGKQAMRDTMGQAAALTGGYGNSYANTAGQQAYQGYLQGLNDKIPDLYNMALSRYNAQGDNLQRNYDALNAQYARQYGEWQDQQDAYQLALQNARNAYDQEYATDYAAYQNAIAQAMDVGNATGNFDRLAEFGYTADEIAAYQKAWITNNPKLAKALGYVKSSTTKKTTVKKSDDDKQTGDVTADDVISAARETLRSGDASYGDVVSQINQAVQQGNVPAAAANDAISQMNNSRWFTNH